MPVRTSIKIKDVAKIAGVSTATVSRALNNPETVAEETRNAVFEAAKKTGYRINLSARNLRRQRTGAVVVLVPNLGNPFFSEILAGIESTLSAEGLSVLMVDTKQAATRPETLFHYLHHSRSDGIISLDGSLPSQILAEAQSGANTVPLIFACEWHDDTDYPAVCTDNDLGCRLSIDHLVSLGHRAIGYVAGPVGNVLTTARLHSTKAAMAARSISIRDDWFLPGDFTLDSGERAAAVLLAMPQRPTAMFCANDETAMGLISGLHRNGVAVPRDMSVVGFDDIDIARHFIPPLTTVHQPRLQIGISAAELLVASMQKQQEFVSVKQAVLPVELILRQSTAEAGRDDGR